MTSEQQQAVSLARQRIARLQPEIIAALLAAIRRVAAVLNEAELARFITSGAVEHIVTVLLADRVMQTATQPLRFALRDAIAKSFRWNVPYLPKGGKINGTVAVAFDQLNPRVAAAVRSLETRVVQQFSEDVRTTVRETIARGLEAKQAPAAIARELRSVIGLAPKDARAVANFRAMLESGDRAALSRILRDRRFDATLEKALGADGKGLSAAQVDKMTDAYRRSVIANNAEVVTRAATHDAYKIANRQSWLSAIDRGIADNVTKSWWHLDAQPNPRPHHAAMQGETVPIERNYSNGDSYAGEGDPWNCHCLDIYGVAA